MPCVGCLLQRLLCVAQAASLSSSPSRCSPPSPHRGHPCLVGWHLGHPTHLGAVASGRGARGRQEGVCLFAPSGLARGESSPRAATTRREKDRGPSRILWTEISVLTTPIICGWPTSPTCLPDRFPGCLQSARYRLGHGRPCRYRVGAGCPQYGLGSASTAGTVIHHSDQGCPYTSIAFGQRCKAAEVRPSMGSAGDCFDHGPVRKFLCHLGM